MVNGFVPEAADWVAVLARNQRYSLDVRLALAAAVAGRPGTEYGNLR
ncbi:hypothetical protein [Enterovirga aerilata]|uniref:Uncharacterized protein n=1 Tax=Enterovirga aerilata TaxID=2730920 RepID=A0A849I807_9HYPH|nr:hypothetical protein [Enterovirga sp. DB1703]NNM73914.1 hypothetical protein [Enterovirga sp. DB1703]